MEFRAFCLPVLVLLAGSYAQPPCTLITPSVLHVESEETLVIDAQGQNGNFVAQVVIQDFPLKKSILAETSVHMNTNNGFLATAKLKVPSKNLLKDTKIKQFVYVVVKAPECPVEKVVLLSFHSGYIFIQSDKTIYTPGSTVLYRLFIVGYSLTPDERTVDVEIINPDGIVVDKNPSSSSDKSGIVSKIYNLPEIANVGTWQIVCRFQVAPQETFKTEFEVKEYVLPSFEVILDLSQKFFYVDDASFTVDISARFLHGKPVEGTGYAVFGAVINNEKKSFPDSITKIKVENGQSSVTLKRHMITSRFFDPAVLLGHSLYVTVTVMTNAGSDLVEAEKTGIPVVKTAFNLLFSKTASYYKPGLPYVLRVSLQNPDGSPAAQVNICTLDAKCGKTNADGDVPIIMNTDENSKKLELQVKTQAQNIPDHRQTTGTITVQEYRSQGDSKNYLHIESTASQVTPGDSIKLNFYIKNKDKQDNFQHFTYLILNKGRIHHVDRLARSKGQTFASVSLPITEDLIPSFRIVAYYVVTGAVREIVSDSIWVDVTDSCVKKLEISHGAKRQDPKPGTVIHLKLVGEPEAKVGLVAVDKAVYVLNRKNRISQSKIWAQVEQSDQGCTPGGGSDVAGVFTDAGLSLRSTTGLSNPTRSEVRCPQSNRRRRSTLITGAKAAKAKAYEDSRLRRCCEDGMQENPMGYKCERRAQYVLDSGNCTKAFLDCCKFIYEPQVIRRGHAIRKQMHAKFHRTSVILTSGSTDEANDDNYMAMEDFVSRSIFSESWMWKMKTLPASRERDGFSSLVFQEVLPDSITTWEFLAISLSQSSGICVAEPYELLVRTDFFIDLRLPYSVVRNEQVEIRAVLHSYAPIQITVRVDLIYNEQFCSSATKTNNFRQLVEIAPGDTLVLPFIIVPLVTGDVRVEVKASVKDQTLTDGVIKKLKVVPEGIKVRKNIQSIILDPRRFESALGEQIIFIEPTPMNDVVPNSDPEVYISVKGDILGETLENSIDGSNLNHLIMVPAGCGEQNMITMTPSVIATRYLDTTNQWESIGVHRREEAIKTIKQGYVQQLFYRKSDNSYAAFTNRPASTWLTAYVVKVFSMASKVTHIEKSIVCGSVRWLLQKQTPEGIFLEDAPVIHGEMMGGSRGTDPDASLTAFILIALVEAKSYCQEEVKDLDNGIKKSAGFLEVRIKSLRKPYSVCIVSYALSLVGKLQNTNHLMSLAKDGSHWADSSSQLYGIESTAYALLTLLQLKAYLLAGPVVQWLTEQRFYGGGYGSTQATIMVFQALSEYQIHVPLIKDIEMDVSLSLPGRTRSIQWRIDSSNAILSRSEKTSMRDVIKVTAKGRGQGTLSVMSVYYAPMTEGAAPCKNFEFSVTLQDAPNAKKPEGALRSMNINICMKFFGDTDSTMTIVDISLLTGFTPDMEDLNMLTNRVDKYISKFEMDTQRSDRGSLIIYLDKVSNTETECLKFKIHQNFEVGVLQPAVVTIYEYYSLENRCTKFYHPTEEHGEMRRICRGVECHCVAENCNLKNAFDTKLDVLGRVAAACEAGVDYVYQAKVEKTGQNGAYDSFTVTIKTIIKQGTDDVTEGTQRTFFSHRSCKESLNITTGNMYLIWGQTKDIWEMKKEISYVISGGTWIEEIPTDEKCAKENSNLCDEIAEFTEHLVSYGCPH